MSTQPASSLLKQLSLRRQQACPVGVGTLPPEFPLLSGLLKVHLIKSDASICPRHVQHFKLYYNFVGVSEKEH